MHMHTETVLDTKIRVRDKLRKAIDIALIFKGAPWEQSRSDNNRFALQRRAKTSLVQRIDRRHYGGVCHDCDAARIRFDEVVDRREGCVGIRNIAIRINIQKRCQRAFR